LFDSCSIPVHSLKNISAPDWIGHQHRHVQLAVQHNPVQTIWKKEAVTEGCAISLVRSFGEEEDQQNTQRRPWGCVAVLHRLVNVYMAAEHRACFRKGNCAVRQ
jgi:hypothetical protein